MGSSAFPAPPPDASSTKRGLINLIAQSFAGLKTFVAGVVLNAKLTFSGLSGTTFENGVANGAGSVAFGFNNTVTMNVAGGRVLELRNNGTVFASFEINSTYGEPTLMIPNPASTVPCIKIGNGYVAKYSGNFQFGSVPAGSDISIQCAGVFIGGGSFVYDGNLNSTNFPCGILVSGQYSANGSVGMVLSASGSAGGANGRGIMVGSANAAPAADFPLFSVCTGLIPSHGFPAADVSGAAPTAFFMKVTGNAMPWWLGTDGSATAGAQTISRPVGKGKIANGATTCVITNSLVTAGSIVQITWEGDHGAARSWVVPGAGSFTVNLSGAASADTIFSFSVKGII